MKFLSVVTPLSIYQNKSEQAISSILKSSLFYEFFGLMYSIIFSNKIMTDLVRKKDDQCRLYKIVKWGNIG